ncbi:MAG TPA: GNAT family N-acetyltransferase [Candidatus Limnocylindria bacterium]|nr:GNAT family N-acetyltransferase [Candidatus Limnocylindria bacterium]
MAEVAPAVSLRNMRPEEFPAFVAHAKEEYAREIASMGGESEEFARRKSEEDHAAILPQGLDTPGHFIFVVESGGERVGVLWLAEREHGSEKQCYIYDVEIDEAHRGKGFGREAMQLAEGEARSRGLDRIALNVFGGNDVARNLYRSLGYVETSVQMAKDLD